MIGGVARGFREFLRGEPVLSVAAGGILADLGAQLSGDGLSSVELVRILAYGAAGFFARALATPAKNPETPTNPSLPSQETREPIRTLRGRRP